MRVRLLLLLLVLVLAEVEDLANRGPCVRGNLDEVHAGFAGAAQGLLGGDHPHLGAVRVDQPHLANADALVDARLVAPRRSDESTLAPYGTPPGWESGRSACSSSKGESRLRAAARAADTAAAGSLRMGVRRRNVRRNASAASRRGPVSTARAVVPERNRSARRMPESGCGSVRPPAPVRSEHDRNTCPATPAADPTQVPGCGHRGARRRLEATDATNPATRRSRMRGRWSRARLTTLGQRRHPVDLGSTRPVLRRSLSCGRRVICHR